jgi:hypothetical protein
LKNYLSEGLKGRAAPSLTHQATLLQLKINKNTVVAEGSSVLFSDPEAG